MSHGINMPVYARFIEVSLQRPELNCWLVDWAKVVEVDEITNPGQDDYGNKDCEMAHVGPNA
jgi:hypothetical protein